MKKQCRECNVILVVHGSSKTFSEVSPICWKCWNAPKSKVAVTAQTNTTTALATTLVIPKFKKGEKVFFVQDDGVFDSQIERVEQYSGYDLYTVFANGKTVDYVLDEDLFYSKNAALHSFKSRPKKNKSFGV